jgi:hypothetical protein
MASAWTVLTDNSKLPAIPGNTAWLHLLNQDGEGGPGGSLVLIDGLDITLDNSVYGLTLDNEALQMDLDNSLTDVTLQADNINATIDYQVVGAQIAADNILVTLDCGATIVPGDELMQKVAGEDLGGFRALVTDGSGQVVHATVARVLAGKEVIGVSTEAVVSGNLCTIGITGDEITELSWNWDTNKSIYVTGDGLLTQTVPETDFLLMVAVPLSPTTIRVRIEPPIFL